MAPFHVNQENKLLPAPPAALCAFHPERPFEAPHLDQVEVAVAHHAGHGVLSLLQAALEPEGTFQSFSTCWTLPFRTYCDVI